RILSPDWIEIKSPARYVATLEERGVVADPVRRKDQVVAEVAKIAAVEHGKALPDADLAEEVANLVEWPEAVLGRFDERYLELPAPIVITAMRAHQRYFALEGDGGKLLPRFVAIRNGRGEGQESIRRGFEAVLRARLEDARFYWENDRKAGLEAKVLELKQIVWHEKLGSIYDRTQRLVQLTEELARQLAPKARDKPAGAPYLTKPDLRRELTGR